MAIQWIGSPNKDKGREGFRPEAIVIHIMEGTLTGTDAWFKSEESGVSAHYGVGNREPSISMWLKAIRLGTPDVSSPPRGDC